MSFKFSMPGLGKYSFFADGTVKSRTTGDRVRTYKDNGKYYYLSNDRGEKEYVHKREIALYGHHVELLQEHETPRQFIDRLLYDRLPENKEIKTVQKDLSGNVIQRFQSVSIASRMTGIDVRQISRCARGERNTAGGFKWGYDFS